MLKLEDIYDVTVAKDGQEALDMVKETMTPSTPESPHEKPFNLIFMDVQMPNVDGLQSTRLIREIGYSAPIVALTAFAEESNIKDCMESGMNHFLSKPIRRPQLKKVLKQYCTPIAEEGEEAAQAEAASASAPPAPATRSGSSMIIVNAPIAEENGETSRPADSSFGPATGVDKFRSEHGQNGPPSPVSPFTNA